VAVTTDILIIGGGVIGINIARGLKKRYRDSKVTLIEKENECGLHASGRNSGVLHAGFYYTPDSLKARFTRLGNRGLTEYCESKNIPLNRCGKLVVAKDQQDQAGMDELIRRGKNNGIRLDELDEKEAKKIEPRVKTHLRALFSPTTSTVDPGRVMTAMKEDALKENIDVRCGVQYLGRRDKALSTSGGEYRAGYVVNAAGLYADKIAKDFGFSEKYRILPFKGLYLYSDEPSGSIRTNVYPVPDLKNPFLGVHFTVTVDGRAKIGPTAVPAFWREQYHGADRFNSSEFVEIILRTLGLAVFSRFGFLELAAQEMTKYSRARMVSLASALMEGVKTENYRRWGRPGIRAQLVNIVERKLEMDFVIEGDDQSLHVLNVVSPGFTCSLPFSEYVCDQVAARLN
jgi:L-2-hydroxyglutarate oxidase LhgO